MKTKDIYVVIHASGWYSDYAEYVVGVTDSYELALSYADKEAEATNNDERYWFDHDTIRIRRYQLNRYNRYLSEAEKVVGNIEVYGNKFEYDETIYEESATQDKFIKAKKKCRLNNYFVDTIINGQMIFIIHTGTEVICQKSISVVNVVNISEYVSQI